MARDTECLSEKKPGEGGWESCQSACEPRCCLGEGLQDAGVGIKNDCCPRELRSNAEPWKQGVRSHFSIFPFLLSMMRKQDVVVQPCSSLLPLMQRYPDYFFAAFRGCHMLVNPLRFWELIRAAASHPKLTAYSIYCSLCIVGRSKG